MRSGSGTESLPILLRWCGGKGRLLAELVSRLPLDFVTRRYVEPFLGGGALFFSLQPRDALIGDSNEELINMYRWVRDTPEFVLVALAQHAATHNKDRYYGLRAAFNGAQLKGTAAQAALFIYLNRTCFNGLWRVNKKGAFNVPWGDRSADQICESNVLRSAAAVLQGVQLESADFAAVLEACGIADFVYMDPPYLQAGDHDFTNYTPGGFDYADHVELAKACRALHERGAKFMLSNSDTPATRELYAGFRIEAVTGRNSVGAAAESRKDRLEIIVRNY